MNPTPYVFFNGTCRDAANFYVEALGGEIVMIMSASEMPPGEMEIPAERADWVMHCTINVGDGAIMMSDNIMGESDNMAGCSIMVSLPSAAEAEAAFKRLADGGAITMPFAPTFWSTGFGTLTDKFGIQWMVGSDEEPAS